MNKGKGFVYVFTGEGKGKTSAAIGTAVRAAGAGLKVVWVGFYKQASWKLSEIEPLKQLGVEVFLMGKGFHIGSSGLGVKSLGKTNIKTAKIAGEQVVVDGTDKEEHMRAAREAIEKAKTLLPETDVLVLDEVNNAIKDDLIRVQEVINLIQERKGTHMILTGRDADPEIVKMADLVTEMKKVRHPYDKGITAIKGLDF